MLYSCSPHHCVTCRLENQGLRIKNRDNCRHRHKIIPLAPQHLPPNGTGSPAGESCHNRIHIPVNGMEFSVIGFCRPVDAVRLVRFHNHDHRPGFLKRLAHMQKSSCDNFSPPRPALFRKKPQAFCPS